MLLLAAGLAGFAVLTLEVLGVHHLAPWFGATALVWSNQIGVVLLALAVGGWLGGWRARSAAEPVRLAGRLLLAAGLLVAAGLLLLPLFGSWVLPEDLRLDEAAGLFLGGSLAAALLFFAPPVLLLGMVAPLLVQSRAEGRGAGRAAGEISAVGTLGSLVGVFGTTLVAIPFLGTRLTLALTAGALALAGVVLLRKPRATAALAVLAFLPVALPDRSADVNLLSGAEVLATRETPYQRLRVIQFEWPGAAGVPVQERWLQMNEGLDSFQSRWWSDGSWPGGYYDLFVLAPIYASYGSETDGPVNLWALGEGAGSCLMPVASALEGREWQASGVEIDPAVVALAREYLPLSEAIDSRLRVLAGRDARSLLRAAPRDLDLILLDAYARQFEIPLHLATQEFFTEVHDHLREGGVLAINVGTTERPGDPEGFLQSLLASLAPSFGANLRAHSVPHSRNVLLFARKGQALPPIAELADLLPAGVPVEVGAACLPAAVWDGPPQSGAAPLRDDRNPLYMRQLLLWLSRGAE